MGCAHVVTSNSYIRGIAPSLSSGGGITAPEEVSGTRLYRRGHLTFIIELLSRTILRPNDADKLLLYGSDFIVISAWRCSLTMPGTHFRNYDKHG